MPLLVGVDGVVAAELLEEVLCGVTDTICVAYPQILTIGTECQEVSLDINGMRRHSTFKPTINLLAGL